MKNSSSPSSDQAKKKGQKTIKGLSKAAIRMRSAKLEFHGLKREFIQFKSSLLAEYRKSKSIKHPRDLGDEREAILRRFLSSHGLIPAKYAVSQVSSRVASQSGHISKQIDITLYNRDEGIQLMRYDGVLEYYPVESVYGVIQVKSRLTATALRDAFENIASFKRLDSLVPVNPTYTSVQSPLTPESRGFGLIFAYESDLSWDKVVQAMKEWGAANPARLWPNAIVILSEGALFYRSENRTTVRSRDLEQLPTPEVMGFPDREGDGLYVFYVTLMDLLADGSAFLPRLSGYYDLPYTAGQLSYHFSLGFFAEVAHCKNHGEYLQEIPQDKLPQIIATAKNAVPINWIRAHDIAYDKPGDDEQRYARQPGEVRIYNPDSMPLTDLLIGERGTLTYISIETSGMTVWLPHFYVIRDCLIIGCPKCARPPKQRIRRGLAKSPPTP